MDFEDATLIRLADASTRRPIFDDLALRHVLDAAFDTSAMELEGPYDATFDEFRLGMFTPPRTALEGGWSGLGGDERVAARFDMTWPNVGGLPRTDAVWLGTVVARASPAHSRVENVSSDWPAVHTLDEDIDPLPGDPVALEQARREALRARLRAGAAQPDAVDDDFIDKILVQAGVATAGELAQRHRGEQATGRIRIAFADPGEPPPTPRRFPVAVALVIRKATTHVVDLLAESKAIQWFLGPRLERPPAPDLRPRNPLVVGWVLPVAVFADPDWPGADSTSPGDAARLARRAAAARWLGPEGVVLVPVEPAG